MPKFYVWFIHTCSSAPLISHSCTFWKYWFKQNKKSKFCIVLLICPPKDVIFWKMCWNQSMKNKNSCWHSIYMRSVFMHWTRNKIWKDTNAWMSEWAQTEWMQKNMNERDDKKRPRDFQYVTNVEIGDLFLEQCSIDFPMECCCPFHRSNLLHFEIFSHWIIQSNEDRFWFYRFLL